jgi:ketosteroid isomerase-like protein
LIKAKGKKKHTPTGGSPSTQSLKVTLRSAIADPRRDDFEGEETQMTEVQRFLDEVVPRQQAADDAIQRGDAEPRKALWSHEDPVTVLGAFGVAASGWAECSELFDWLGSKFTGSESFELEIVAAGVSGDLAYTLRYEHSIASRDGGPMRPNRLRVTHVYPPR